MDGAPLFTQLCVGNLWRGVRDVKKNNTGLCTMPRPADRTTMKERILETTDRLFYGQGIRAVGVDTGPPRSGSASARSTTTSPRRTR